MRRGTVALTVGFLLACGGLDSATDALGDRIGEQITEELLEGALEHGLEAADVEINDGEFVLKTKEGESIALKQASALPDDFPTHPQGFEVKQVNEITGTKAMVNAIGTTADLPKLVKEVKADLEGKGYAVQVEQAGAIGELKSQTLIMGKDQDVVMLVAQERPKDSTVTLSWTQKQP